MLLPQAVFLDMDGTLVDTERLWWRAVAEVAARAGRPVGPADRPEIVGQAVAHTAAHLAADLDLPAVQLAARLELAFLSLVREELVVLPGAEHLLRLLGAQGIPAALVSASPRVVVDVVLDLIGRELFSWSVAEGETARTKPHPDPYLAAASHLGVAPGACLAIEDSAPGIASATAAGLCLVLAPAADEHHDWIRVGSLTELDLPFLSGVMSAQRSPGLREEHRVR